MPWRFRSVHDLDIIDEIRGQSDRITGIVASAFLEDELADVILSRLYTNSDVKGNLFKGDDAPFGAFYGKIEIGFALGLYTNETRKDMHYIRKIRNRFAHHSAPASFDDPMNIAEWCDAMTVLMRASENLSSFGIPEMPPFDISALTRRDKFILSVQVIMNWLVTVSQACLAKTPHLTPLL
jgi:hypothetical protein